MENEGSNGNDRAYPVAAKSGWRERREAGYAEGVGGEGWRSTGWSRSAGTTPCAR